MANIEVGFLVDPKVFIDSRIGFRRGRRHIRHFSNGLRCSFYAFILLIYYIVLELYCFDAVADIVEFCTEYVPLDTRLIPRWFSDEVVSVPTPIW